MLCSRGNIALDGCIVKTAGVDESILVFAGPARVFESQDSAVEGILKSKVKAGDIVVIRYEGPRGGPGMQEMLYPTSYLKSRGLGKACALITDGRFSGGTSGLSIGHCSPEAAEGGLIGLVQENDRIEIDIPNRRLELMVPEAELAKRRAAMEARGKDAWKPIEKRKRKITTALKAYAALDDECRARCRARGRLNQSRAFSELISMSAAQFVWYDVMTNDCRAAEQFYRDVIGWNTVDSGVPGPHLHFAVCRQHHGRRPDAHSGRSGSGWRKACVDGLCRRQ